MNAEIEFIALIAGCLALLVGFCALRRASRAAAALAAERVERLSAGEAATAALRLAAERIEAVEQRVGKGQRVTAARRDRALELLAAGASETAVARQSGLRQAEVAVLAHLRSRSGVRALAN